MAVVVETGAGVAGANSYISVIDATTYLTARGKTDAWDAIEDKDAALVRATDFLDRRYKWRGAKVSKTQTLQWPRTEATDDDGFTWDAAVPHLVAWACAEMAVRATVELEPDLERGGAIQSASVGPLSVTYAPGASPRTKYTAVDDMLATLTYEGGSSMRSAPFFSDSGEKDAFSLDQMTNDPLFGNASF